MKEERIAFSVADDIRQAEITVKKEYHENLALLKGILESSQVQSH